VSDQEKYDRIFFLIALLCTLNFAFFIGIADRIGGDTYFGYARDGHFYLGKKGGFFTEVSEAVYRYSQIHGASIWITHPLALFFCFLMGRSPK
jgi:hypothetical protein